MIYQNKNKNCQNCKKDFVIEVDDFSFYDKMKVPPPTLCSKCRRIRRLSWRNDFSLYSRDCFMCSKKFISIYAENTGFKVLCPKCFHSDNWDPYDYGMDYDKDKSFVEQVINLYKSMPVLGIINDNEIASINCLYTNDVAFSKNCAMVFVAWKLENVFNSSNLTGGKDLADCMYVIGDCAYTYDGIMINNVANCKSIYWSSSCVDCYFSYDLKGCSDCFMCFGLRNKKYYFKNQQYNKDEYKKIVESYNLHTRIGYNKAKEEFMEYFKNFPRKYSELRNCVDCTGTDMIRSKNTRNSKFASYSEDSKYLYGGTGFKNCYDCNVGGDTELAYECITPDNSYNSIVTIESWKNSHASYCIDAHSCANVLGCVGVKKGEYVILNKKYSKQEYLELYEVILKDMKERGEWGEFFATKYSPFGINETGAIHELNLSKNDAMNLGYKWQDEIQETRGKESLKQQDVPDSILDIDEDIVNEILACVTCQRNYKILSDEITLYRRLKIPIPDKCFFCRYKERVNIGSGPDLIKRVCDCTQSNHSHDEKCEEVFETFFTNKEERLIYCENCYKGELI